MRTIEEALRELRKINEGVNVKTHTSSNDILDYDRELKEVSSDNELADVEERLNESTFNSPFYTFEDWYQGLSERMQNLVDQLADDMELPNYEDCTDDELAQLHDNFVNRYNLEESTKDIRNSILPFSYTDDQLNKALQEKLDKKNLDTSITVTGNYHHDYWDEYWDEKEVEINYDIYAYTTEDNEIKVSCVVTVAGMHEEEEEKTFHKQDLIDFVNSEPNDVPVTFEDLVDWILDNVEGDFNYLVERAEEDFDTHDLFNPEPDYDERDD